MFDKRTDGDTLIWSSWSRGEVLCIFVYFLFKCLVGKFVNKDAQNHRVQSTPLSVCLFHPETFSTEPDRLCPSLGEERLFNYLQHVEIKWNSKQENIHFYLLYKSALTGNLKYLETPSCIDTDTDVF